MLTSNCILCSFGTVNGILKGKDSVFIGINSDVKKLSIVFKHKAITKLILK